MIHNPRNVSEELLQPELGYRFLTPQEVEEVTDAMWVPGIEGWVPGIIAEGFWSDGYNGDSSNVTYRTKLSVEELRRLRAGDAKFHSLPDILDLAL